MKTLLIGDVHFGCRSNNISWLELQLEFFEKQVIPEIESGDYDNVVFLGDVFDIRYSINEQVGIEVKDLFRKLSHVSREVIVVAGNHDYYSPLQEFQHYNAYSLVFGPEFVAAHPNLHFITDAPYFSDGMLFLPWYWTEDINLFKKARFTKGIFYEDLDFMMKVVPSISKAVWIDRPIYHYTMRPDSITGNFTLKRLDVLDVTDRIIANAAAHHPELLPAARDRSLSANFNMFVLLVSNGYSHSLHADRCWNNIKSLRFGSLFNRHVRLKNKLGILASLPGRRFFSVIIRIYNKL